jgi:hypothetical protein
MGIPVFTEFPCLKIFPLHNFQKCDCILAYLHTSPYLWYWIVVTIDKSYSARSKDDLPEMKDDLPEMKDDFIWLLEAKVEEVFHLNGTFSELQWLSRSPHLKFGPFWSIKLFGVVLQSSIGP